MAFWHKGMFDVPWKHKQDDHPEQQKEKKTLRSPFVFYTMKFRLAM